jgi:organic radical activating enzyme
MTIIKIVRQNADINAKANDYPPMEADELLIASTFTTIQGEGPMAGQRAFFIRTSGCNFGAKTHACEWCDTSFAVRDGVIHSFIYLLDKIKAVGTPLVVLTGGEPLLQTNTPRFIEFLLKAGVQVQLETNGAFLHRVEELAAIYANLHIVCSPKQVGGRYASQPPKFKYASAINPIHFKFVVSSDPDNTHYTLPQWAGVPTNSVFWVSPMTIYKKEYHGEVSSVWDDELVDRAACEANYRRAALMVMDNAFLRFTCQLHTLMAIA